MPQHGPRPDLALLSRRRLLQAGLTGSALFLAGTRAAAQSPSAGVPASVPPGSPVASARSAPSASPPEPGGTFRMASWIGYIDTADDGSWPSLGRFTEETGIEVDYQEAVNDNNEFFASDLQGPIGAGQPTGWDLVVLTDWMAQRLAALGWLEPIDTSWMRNYPRTLVDLYADRPWDPDNRLAAPWQAGMTGLGYDAAVTGELSDVNVLFADTHAGQVTYLSEMRDTVGLAALGEGIDPATITEDEFTAMVDKVRAAVDAGIPRRITGNDYVEDMIAGDVVLAIAWSGDVLTLVAPAAGPDQDIRFTVPEQGGMLWSDNMVVPKGAQNRQGAERFIDWYYDPVNAAPIEAYVTYVCPVEGVQAVLQATDPETAANSLVFPDAAMRARLHAFRALDVETASAWEARFAEAIGL